MVTSYAYYYLVGCIILAHFLLFGYFFYSSSEHKSRFKKLIFAVTTLSKLTVISVLKCFVYLASTFVVFVLFIGVSVKDFFFKKATLG